MWKGSNPDRNANKTTADVVLALKQYKQITQQPQNSASTRARYDAFQINLWKNFLSILGFGLSLPL